MTQLPMFQPTAQWTPPRVTDLPSWADARRVSVDTETNDPQLKKLGPGVRRGAYIAGYSFSIEDGPSFYVPMRHEGGDNVDCAETAMRYLREQAKIFRGELCGANLQYDLDFLAEEDIVFRSVSWFRDCQVAEPLIDELQFTYSLDAIAQRRGLPGKDETLLREGASAWKVDPKKDLWRLPARFVGAYAIQDTELPLQLLRRQERDIDDQGLWDIYNLESQVLPILLKMRRRGVRIDLDRLASIEDWSVQEETACLERVYAETGVRVPVGETMNAGRLAKVLKKIGVEVPLTPKTKKPSISKELLDGLDHPVAKELLNARKISKLRTTFCSSIRSHLIGDRVHCTFNQLRKTTEGDDDEKGGRYGRLSSSDPNLQQQLSPDRFFVGDLDVGKMWRSIYVPDGDGLWACCDYSQQEPRATVHFAEAARCHGAAKAGNAYRDDPDTDNHTMMARIVFGYSPTEQPSKVERTQAKIIFLGLCYSMGGAKLARGLGLETKWITTRGGKYVETAGDEAQSILDQFDRQMPFVRQLAKMCEDKAKRVGYIKTIGGRRCRFPKHESGKGWDWCHKALNRLIQGSAADQTKKAMVDLDAAGYKVQLQVHDEIDQTVESREHAEGIAEIMRKCLPLSVPSKVDVEVGPSWGEVK